MHWPGGPGGVPFRGANPPLLKNAELDNLPTVGDKHVAWFDLTNSDQLGNYIWVLDRAKNGLFTVDFIQRFFDPANSRISVYVEWTQFATQLPPGGRDVSLHR